MAPTILHRYVSTIRLALRSILIQPPLECHSLDSSTLIRSHPSLTLLRWFFTAGSADTNVYYNNLTTMLFLCERINAPIKPSKVEGPSTSLTFLGIHLNTVTMEASITLEWKQALLFELLQLRYQCKFTKRALNWEAFILLQSFTSWPNLLVEIDRSQYYSKKASPPPTTICRG